MKISGKKKFDDNFVIIPKQVYSSKNIPANAKLLYGMIHALSHPKCIASNWYLAENIGVSPKSISRLLRALKNEREIVVEFTHQNHGTYRHIYLNDKRDEDDDWGPPNLQKEIKQNEGIANDSDF